jgi:hypothetical protein
MRAITLHQPWASLIAIEAKPCETRSYPPPAKLIGRRIAIHAAKTDHSNSLLLTLGRETVNAIADALEDGGYGHRASWSQLPRGAVVCTEVIAGAYRCGTTADPGFVHVTERRGNGLPYLTIKTDPFGDYSPGRWAWLLADVRRLEVPEPAKGKQGWWEWEGQDNG